MTSLPASSPPDDEQVSRLVRRATDLNSLFDAAVIRMNEEDGQLSDLAYQEHVDYNDTRGMLVPSLLRALVALQRQRADEHRALLAIVTDMKQEVKDLDRFDEMSEDPVVCALAQMSSGAAYAIQSYADRIEHALRALLTGSGDGTTAGTGEGTETP